MENNSNNNGPINNDNNSSPKVRNIDELLAAKRTSNQHGNNQASEAIKKASNAVRGNAGKAKRSELRSNLIKSAQLAQAQGEEEGIKEFLGEDIPAVIKVLNGEIKSNHLSLVEANEAALIEGVAIDVEWQEYNYEDEFDMSFDDVDMPTLSPGSSMAQLPSENIPAPKVNKFGDDLPEL